MFAHDRKQGGKDTRDTKVENQLANVGEVGDLRRPMFGLIAKQIRRIFGVEPFRLLSVFLRV